MPGLRCCFTPAPFPLVRKAPFSDEILGELLAHHQLADFRTGQDQLALLRLGFRAQPALALLQEDPLAALELPLAGEMSKEIESDL